MAGTNRSGTGPKRRGGQDMGYQKNTNLVQRHDFEGQSPTVARVKTDGRIGSVTPPGYLKGGSTSVDNNKKAGPSGNLGVEAQKHMGLGHVGGSSWAPRVAKARATASAGRAAKHRTHTEPINLKRGGLKSVKPD